MYFLEAMISVGALGMRKPTWVTRRGFRIGVIVFFSILGTFGAGTLINYVTWPEWTGFEEDKAISTSTATKINDKTTITTIENPEPGKTLWDLLSVLVVPASLVGLGFLLQQLQQKRVDEEAKEEALQAYFDRLSTLLVDKQLIATAKGIKKVSKEDEELAEAAKDLIQAWTVSILRRLKEDDERKSNVIQFLSETEIISTLKLDVNRFDLKNFNFKGINFQNANLEGVNFENRDFRGANLQWANLQGANFQGANLEGVHFGGAKLQKANLRDANLKRTNFFSISWDPESDRPFNSTDLSKADLMNADLMNANLSGVNFSGANLSKANLEGAKLTQLHALDEEWGTDEYRISADFSGAKLCNASLSNVDFEAVGINGADFREADLSKAQGLSKRKLYTTKLCKTKLPEEFSSMSDQHCKLLEITTESD